MSVTKRKILLVSRCAWTLANFRTGLMRTLQAHGHTVLSGGAAGDGFDTQIMALGIPFVPLPVDKRGMNPRADVRLLWTLYRWYRQERPAIVHHFTIKPVIYGSIAARLAGVPRIINTVTGLGYVFMEDTLPWLRRLVEWQYRCALASAHFTFFLNEDDRALFLTRGLIATAKAGLLPGEGLDCTFFAPRLPSPRHQGCNFLFVGRLLRDKGLYEFVNAARLVRQAFPAARFSLLGKRDERNPTVVPKDQIEAWQSEGVVTWLGETPDVRPMLANADVVVLPSYREGLPRALLEAAAMEKPLIATEVAGCRDVVSHGTNGLLVPARDVQALAQAMIHLLHYPALREQMGKAGREKVMREFDERLVLERILRVYHPESTCSMTTVSSHLDEGV